MEQGDLSQRVSITPKGEIGALVFVGGKQAETAKMRKEDMQDT
jgi:hypothetical protein